MSKREIAALACRILALYAFIQALASIGFVPWMIVRASETAGLLKSVLYVLMGVLPFTLCTGAGIVLWVQAQRIGGRMLSGLDDPEAEMKVVPFDLQVIAFSVVGLALLVQTVPRLVSTFWMLLYARAKWPPELQEIYRVRVDWKNAITMVVRLGLGLWLLLGARGLVGFLRKVRTAGHKKSESSEADQREP